jgi:DnaJ-class molecular chaperone
VLARSHALLDRSARLIATIQRQIDKDTHKHNGYALEMCGFCNGLGRASERACQVCYGKRTVLVYQPGVKCPRCKGDGKATIYGSCDPEALSSSDLCVSCRGSGWARSVPQI